MKRFLPEESQSFLAIYSSGHLVPGAIQNPLQQITVHFFVIDDQNALRDHSFFPFACR